jgi:hypothetical protein
MDTPVLDTPPVVDKMSPTRLRAALRRLQIALVSLAIAFVAVESFHSWQLYKLKKDISGLQWSNALTLRDDDSVITTDVGSIQFMKRGGYSIELSTAKYTADGLYLQGVIGNPTHLTISSLSLKFTATKQLYQFQDEYDKDPYLMFGLPSIGEAQCSPIAYLGSGMTAPFEVTIPNVKQTKEGIRLMVAFTGERYSY